MGFIIRFYRIKENYIALFYNERAEYNSCQFKLERYIEKQKQNIFSDNVQFKNIVLTNFDNEDTLLFDLLDDSKLIYRFTKKSCVACVESDLQIINMLSDSIGVNNIVILSDYDELIKAKAYLSQMGVKSPCYNYKGKFNFSMERDTITQPPFFFLADRNKRVRFPYKTDDNHSFSSYYFKRIISYFKSGE